MIFWMSLGLGLLWRNTSLSRGYSYGYGYGGSYALDQNDSIRVYVMAAAVHFVLKITCLSGDNG